MGRIHIYIIGLGLGWDAMTKRNITADYMYLDISMFGNSIGVHAIEQNSFSTNTYNHSDLDWIATLMFHKTQYIKYRIFEI